MDLVLNSVGTINSSLSICRAERDADGNIIDFDILYMNDEACRTTGITKSKISLKKLKELFIGSNIDGIINVFVRVVETGETACRYVHLDFTSMQGDAGQYNMVCSKYEDGVVVFWQGMEKHKGSTVERVELFQKRANESDSLVFITDNNLKISFFNKKWLDYRKTDLNTELDKMAKDYIHPSDINGFFETLKEISFKNEPGVLEFRLMNKHGVYRWVNGVVTPEFTDTGSFVGCVAYCADFTERKMYAESIQRFSSIISAVDVGIILKDKHGNITEWNNGAQNILGYVAEEVIGKTSDIYLIEEQREENKSINNYIKDTLQSVHVWIKCRHKNGRIIISYASFAPILDINNEFSGSFVMFRDMTEDKLSEEKARNMAAIFNIADAGIILKNLDGEIRDWNVGAESILGYSRDEMIGKTTKDYTPEEGYPLLEDIERRIINGEHISHVEVVRKHKDGRIIDCSVSYTPTLDAESKIVGSVAIFHDITDKKIAEEKAKNLAAIFSGADAGIILKDKNGLITDWNVGAQNILGYDESEIIGNTSTNYTPKEYIKYSNDIEKRIKEGEHIGHTELVRKHKSGNNIYLSASFTPIRDKRGNITGSVAIFHDITESKRIEKEHKELENTLSNLFDNLSNGFCLYELVKTDGIKDDLKIVMANRAFSQLLNEPYESLPGRLFTEVCSGDAEYLNTYISVANTGANLSFENYSYFLKKHISVVLYSPVCGQVAVIISDRSHLVEAEQALKERENSLALLFSSMTSGFCMGRVERNSSGEIVDIVLEMVNKAFEEMESNLPSPISGKRLSDFSELKSYFPVFVDVATNRVKRNFKKHVSYSNATLDVICFSPKEDYFVCVENDISEQVKAEEELKKAYRDTAAIIREIPAPICVVSKEDGVILDSNVAFAKMCRLNGKNNMTGTPISKFFIRQAHNADINILESLCAGINFTCQMKKIDGSEIEIQVFSRPMFYNEQDAFAVHCIDLTQQRIQEQVLREAANTAEEASKMKSTFLANMSHEIRTPLNGVIGFAELALDDQGIGEKTKDYLNKIRVSAYGLLEIINDVLDVSKIESGKVEIEKVPFLLHDIFKHCETISSPRAIEKGITLYFYSEPYIGKKLIGDPTKLRQVLLNLLSNAIKFTNIGIVKVMSIAETISENQMKIHFEVKDSGIGMSEEQIEKVFEPFIQADSSTTRKYGGTGLGLAITRSLVELMGGKINIDSLPGIGSRFSFTLVFDTIEVPVNDSESAETSVTIINKPIFKGEVLVCEDNEINQQVIREHLIRIGLTPTVTPNGKAGVEAAKIRIKQGKPFDAILMDIHMPIMDGLEATQKLLDMGIKAPIIAMTANVMSKDRENYLSQGMSDYIGKPFVSHELWACLLKFLIPVDLAAVVEESDDPSFESIRDIINTSLGIERAAGDKKLYARLLTSFVKSNKNAYADLTNAIESGDRKLAHRMAHTIKGVAATIGAIRLQNASASLEAVLSDKDSQIPEELLKSFERELNAVLKELSPLDRETKELNTHSGVLNKAEAIELVERLEPLLISGDSYSIDLLERTKEKLIPLGNLYEELVSKMEDYEFEAAHETLERIKLLLEE